MSDESVEVDVEEAEPAPVLPLGQTVNEDGSVTLADAEGNEIETEYPLGSEEREQATQEKIERAAAEAEEQEAEEG